MTSKFFCIYSVYKNYQILSLHLVWDKRNNCSYFSCYLLPKLSEIIVENLSITLFRVTTTIADIFYPIFILTITILACFIRKKKQSCSGDLHPHVHQGIDLDPMECLQLDPDPQLQSFLAFPRTDAPISFQYYPLKYFLKLFNFKVKLEHIRN